MIEQPFFTEILSDLQEDDVTIGLNGINWNPELYPYLYEHKDRLIYRFNQKYKYREIGAETPGRWMNLLQNRFDEVANKYNHAYKVYNDADLDALGTGYVRHVVYDGSSKNIHESTTEANSKFKDTPTSGTSTINNPTTENVDTSTGEGSNEGTSKGESTETYKYNDEHILDETNKIVDRYKSLDEDFISQFNNMFMGILTILE